LDIFLAQAKGLAARKQTVFDNGVAISFCSFYPGTTPANIQRYYEGNQREAREEAYAPVRWVIVQIEANIAVPTIKTTGTHADGQIETDPHSERDNAVFDVA